MLPQDVLMDGVMAVCVGLSRDDLLLEGSVDHDVRGRRFDFTGSFFLDSFGRLRRQKYLLY